MINQVGSSMIMLVFDLFHSNVLLFYLLIKLINGQMSCRINHDLSFEK